MADYLIEQYNAKVQAVQDREAKALAGALEIYTDAMRQIVETAALDRVEAGAELAAAMAQRDHEYQNGRPTPQPVAMAPADGDGVIDESRRGLPKIEGLKIFEEATHDDV